MFQKFIFNVLMRALAAASPEILEGIRQGVEVMMVKAIATVNPWDDIAVGLLQMLIGHPKEPPPSPDESGDETSDGMN